MTTSISGQLPNSSVSLVPTAASSQSQEQKIPLIVPTVVPGVAAKIAKEFVYSHENFVSISKDGKPSSEERSANRDSDGSNENKVSEIVVPQPVTMTSCLLPPPTTSSSSSSSSSTVTQTPDPPLSNVQNFGSRNSSFVPYVNLNNYSSIRSHVPSSEALYIPPTSHITAPVQMYSSPGLDQDDRNKSWSFRPSEMMTSPDDSSNSSVLSQYFSQQNQVSRT